MDTHLDTLLDALIKAKRPEQKKILTMELKNAFNIGAKKQTELYNMKKSRKFKSTNDLERPSDAQVFTEPSLTVPDQALSIKEIIRRHTAGQSIPMQEMAYEAETEAQIKAKGVEDLRALDKQDKLVAAKEMGKLAKQTQAKLNKAAEAKKKALLKQQAKPSTKGDKPQEQESQKEL